MRTEAIKPTRQRMLDAAVELIAYDGIRALTFRKIEDAAGATHGSTMYYFKNRDQLFVEVLRHIAKQDEEIVQSWPAMRELANISADSDLRKLIADTLHEFLTTSRARTLTRYELFLYAARRPELQSEIAHWRGTFFALVEPILAKLGASDPGESARFFMSAFDGILMDLLANPDPDFLEKLPAYLESLLMTAAKL